MDKEGFSLVVPVLNEQGNIKSLIERLNVAIPEAADNFEIIFIDDWSSDHTVEEIKHYSKNLPIVVFSKLGKLGKSYSLLEGFDRCRYGIVGMIDGDLQYPPEALPEMIKKVSGTEADIVIGSRKQYGAKKSRLIGTKIIINTYRLLFKMAYDTQSGLKVFKKEILGQLDLSRVTAWTLDFELLNQALQKNYVIDSVDILFSERIEGKSKVDPLLVGSEIIYHAMGAKARRTFEPLSNLAKRTWVKQFLSFSIIGLLNTLLDIGLFLGLTSYVSIFAAHIIIAKAVSFSIAATNSFILNRHFTFKHKGQFRKLYIPYLITSTIGLGLNTGALYLAINAAHANRITALILATSATLLWNFSINKLWVFTVSIPKKPARIYQVKPV
ncbi:MAG TPA: bifunctional glycosyltransferase family 2/GtrA family protein [Candidatus Dormibacteraeota bacterium]|nr:bifunctional glycosyltransferase family 2/GtrA family protein [Candidatus Dormibacteraeota bacterium]